MTDYNFEEFYNKLVKDKMEIIERDSMSVKIHYLHIRKYDKDALIPIVEMTGTTSPLKIVSMILNKLQPDYYIFVFGAFGATEQNYNDAPDKRIAKLPGSRRFEMIFFLGRSKDLKYNFIKAFQITRENPDDDESKIIKVEDAHLDGYKFGYDLPYERR